MYPSGQQKQTSQVTQRMWYSSQQSVISSKPRWFHRMHELQKALSKACRQLTLYILVCTALNATWVCRYSLPLKVYRKEEIQMKVKIVTCPDVLPFEMNSGRVLVQLTKIIVKDNIIYNIFLNHKSEGWVKSDRFSKAALWLCCPQAGHRVTQLSWAGGLLPCIPVLHTDQGGWMHRHLTVLFPAISALSSPHTAALLKSVPGGHRLKGVVQTPPPAAAFPGAINLRERQSQTWNSKCRIFLWMWLYW